jgi:hypothetical protein
MSYKINFVGIVYFDTDPDNKNSRRVLLPNGTNPGNGIEPHLATINIASSRLVGDPKWGSGAPKRRTIDLSKSVSYRASMQPSSVASSTAIAVMDEEEGAVELQTFPITERSTITITGLEGKGVDAQEHNGKLPRLMDQNPPVVVDADADTIATLTISNGKLVARQLPAANGPGAIVSQLQVPGDFNSLTIRVTDAKETRTITVLDGTEIVIANVSGDITGGADETGHFQIYRKLSPRNTVTLRQPAINDRVAPLATRHPFLVDPLDFPEAKCSNTCCARRG